ncbi:MAG: anhydro-N-acetylmuramic acid kinase [Bacteroidetes bacterium 4484_249]|nr:MAG: anhydro-N-acetylmuramic acid kinase [Bacteroidetes bacterium 4484_249]
MKEYKVIGLMSGTSLDGVDIAFCKFIFDKEWRFEIIHAETIEYPEEWLDRLVKLPQTHAEFLTQTNVEYGHYLGQITKDFIDRKKIKPEFISSHGHTIFHQPEKHFTLQIGDGASIAAETGLPVVFDFRSLDVARGGQGAPLVPVGDKLLFGEYNYCLNLGGIANISYEEKGRRIAFDICPVNQALNYLTNECGKSFDDKGMIASSGNVNAELSDTLNELKYYSQLPPKSLGKEWVEKFIFPILNTFSIPVEDKLRTFSEHIAQQISKVLKTETGKLLITGGGAYNDFLIKMIRNYTKNEIIVPDKILIEYKEAMIFAFLGVLKIRGEVNCLSSVTGAKEDSSGGVVV